MYHPQLLVILLLLELSIIINGDEVSTCKFVEKKNYEIITNPRLNWHKALYHCHSQNKRLATIKDSKENEAFIAYVRSAYPSVRDASAGIWIGGDDFGEHGTWMWTDIGNKIEFFNWNVGEPNRIGNNERCIEPITWDLRWNDAVCSLERPFVCEHTYKEPLCSSVNL